MSPTECLDECEAAFKGGGSTVMYDLRHRTIFETMIELRDAGKPIAAIDSLIAASVLEGKYTLVTRNEDDFQDTGMPLVNPWKLP